jgi:hypothetical protein
VPTDGDLAGYIRDFQAGGHPVQHVKDLTCTRCRGTEFLLAVDDDDICAVATCRNCRISRPIADSGQRLRDAEPGECDCVCGGETFAVAVGFAMTGADVRWVTVGLRCLTDDVLGVILDWEITERPSAHLLTAA